MARSSVVLRRTLMAAAAVIATSAAVPTIASAGPDISGTWFSVSPEGVPQTMTVERTADQKQYSVRAESPKLEACDGMEASASGLGTLADEQTLTVNYSVTCMVDRAAVCSFEATTAYSVDLASGEMSDEFASVWRRTTPTSPAPSPSTFPTVSPPASQPASPPVSSPASPPVSQPASAPVSSAVNG